MTSSLVPEHRPATYPSDLETWVELNDGRSVFIRPVVDDDASLLRRELERADQETLYQRFFRAPVRLTPAQIERMTSLDYQTRLALVAFSVEGDAIGIARYEAVAPGEAEVAVVVQQGTRGLGLATQLLHHLELAAIRRGVSRFTAVYLPDNMAIARLLSQRGFTIGLAKDGVAAAEKQLPAA